MGLDILAYEIATPVAGGFSHTHTEACYDEGHIHVHSEWPETLAGLDIQRDGETWESGCIIPSGKELHFRAGSYSGYGVFREALAMAALGAVPRLVWAEPEEFKGRPFYELINFSDCEGVIAGEVSAKLAADFVTHAEPVKAAMGAAPGQSFDDWMVTAYDNWHQAFTIAADTGIVVFA